MGKVLSESVLGKTVVGTHKVSGLKRAIKILNNSTCNLAIEAKEAFENEVKILTSMDHPCIVSIHEYYEGKNHFYIVTDLCNGGELFDYLVENQTVSEAQAVSIIKQLLSAIRHCHENNVVHRDLKPENILLDSKPVGKDQEIKIKIIDFATSSLLEPNQTLSKRIGTAYYVAPEVIAGHYDHKVDIWSIGVIAYLLLVGYPPFNGRNEHQILQRVAQGKFVFKTDDWQNISQHAKDFITQMLKPPDCRISAEDALKLPWMTNCKSTRSNEVIEATLTSLQTFHADRKLQRAVLSFIASQLLSENEVQECRDQFNSLDTNMDGCIDREELIMAYEKVRKKHGGTFSPDEILRQLDTDGNGQIEYSEFLLATMDLKKALSKDNLKAAFHQFDRDGSGMISIDEIRQVVGENGTSSEETWNKILEEVDTDGNGEIDIKEFQRFMLARV